LLRFSRAARGAQSGCFAFRVHGSGAAAAVQSFLAAAVRDWRAGKHERGVIVCVLQWMDEEYFGCCTRTLTTGEVVTGRQFCNRKRRSCCIYFHSAAPQLGHLAQ
jgi:hypothetical protein